MHEDLLSQGETNECEQQIAKVGRVELIGLSCQALEDIFVLQQTIEKIKIWYIVKTYGWSLKTDINSILCTSTKAYNMDHPQEYSSCDLGVHWWWTWQMRWASWGPVFKPVGLSGKDGEKPPKTPDTEDDCEVIYPISFYDIIYIYTWCDIGHFKGFNFKVVVSWLIWSCWHEDISDLPWQVVKNQDMGCWLSVSISHFFALFLARLNS